MQILQFTVRERGKWAYILWPWETPESFLYEAFQHGARYKLRRPVIVNQLTWVEFVPTEGAYGEYSNGLFFGKTPWWYGYRLWRRFSARGAHYLAQHGLDGIPAKLHAAAREYNPGEPMGPVKFQFRIATAKRGSFDMTFYDWLHYLASGRNGHISEMAISYKHRKGK